MNPEFQRNLWLQLTPERLLVMPAVLALVLTAVSALGWEAMVAVPWYAAAALGLIWGPRLASASVLAEVAGRTWDWQRSSALTGWQMTWGKLAGATIYPWYGIGLASLAAMAALLLQPHATPPAPRSGALAVFALDWARLVLCCGLGQAAALLLALLLLARGGEAGRGNRISAELGGYVAGLGAFLIASGAARQGGLGVLAWFGWQPGATVLELGSLLFWSGWAVVGAWRLMARELQFPLSPRAWPAFVLTAAAWLAGFVDRTGLPGLPDPGAAGSSVSPGLLQGYARCLVFLIAVVAATWIAALADAKSPVQLLRWRAALRAGRWAPALALMPSWMMGLPVLLAALLGLVAVMAALGTAMPAGPAGTAAGWRWTPALLVLSLILFLVRDVALMYACAPYGGPRRRVPALVYLAVLYGVLPGAAAAIGAHPLIPALVPLPFVDSVSPLALALLLAQMGLSGALAGRALARALRAR